MGERTFPVMWQGDRRYNELLKRLGCPRVVAWGFIEAFRAECMRNHDQTPERLAERGGLAPNEIVALGEQDPDARYRAWYQPASESVPLMLAMIAKWKAAQTTDTAKATP